MNTETLRHLLLIYPKKQQENGIFPAVFYAVFIFFEIPDTNGRENICITSRWRTSPL